MLWVAAVLVLSCTAQATQTNPPAGEGAAWHNRQILALLERNAERGWRTTTSGLRWRRICGDGRGLRPTRASLVTVDYSGHLTDGSIFDSSVERGQPITVPLSAVIEGWQEGLMLMAEGDCFELAIPASLAYGAKGWKPVIPENATLLFTMKLIAVKPGN